MKLTQFSDPDNFGKVERNIMTRFLEGFADCLPPEAAAMLTEPALLWRPYCQQWATHFKTPEKFGAPLIKALKEIEMLALPENEELFKEAMARVPEDWINRNLAALHQCVHLWLVVQAKSAPGLIFPSAEFGVRSAECVSNAECGIRSAESATCAANGGVEEGNSPRPNPSPAGRGESAEPECGAEAAANGGMNSAGHGTGGLRCMNVENEDPSPRTLSPSEGEREKTPECGSSETSEEAGSAPQSGEPAPTFERLARLSRIEYEQVRRAEAKRLGLRLRAMDEEVDRVRDLQDDAQANRVKLPELEPWPEPVTDASGLFDAVNERYGNYLYAPNLVDVVMTLWTGHAHAIKAFVLSPRLNFMSSEPGCGKSTAMDVMVTMLPKVLRTDNLKTAVLFRVVDQQQPTLLLDEVDSYLHLFPDLRGLINGGHSAGGCAMRCEGKGVRSFKAYAATALAGIGSLTRTLRDRSIVIHLEKAPPGALKARFDRRRVKVEHELGRKMARWAKDNFEAIAACDPVMPPEAWNRVGDNWRPLFAIAQTIGGHWPQRALEAFQALTRAGQVTPATGTVVGTDASQRLAPLDAEVPSENFKVSFCEISG